MPIHFKASANFDLSIDGEAAMALYKSLQHVSPATERNGDSPESQTDAERLMAIHSEAAQAAQAEVNDLKELQGQLVDSDESTIIDDNSLGGSNPRKNKTSNGGV